METKLPKHIAIIMDGNGTWAKKRGLPRTLGHKKGSETLVSVAKECSNLGIKYLTVYAFSTENWSRPKDEVDYLMSLPHSMISRYEEDLMRDNIKLRFIGFRDRIDERTKKEIDRIEKKTGNNTGLELLVAFNYGSRDEIIKATKEIASEVNDGKISVDDITKDYFSKKLFTANIPDVDLLIRTSNQIRISNFLLWQISYSELYFTNTLWPDFSKEDLDKAIEAYNNRDRRYGGIKK